MYLPKCDILHKIQLKTVNSKSVFLTQISMDNQLCKHTSIVINSICVKWRTRLISNDYRSHGTADFRYVC